jgi:parvulin-like peptidyl-prolyl isomerase
MKWKLAAATLLAVIAGIGCGQLACRSISCRDAIGRLFERGHLLALAGGRGIYEVDVERAVAEARDANDLDDADSTESVLSRESILSRLAMNAAVQDMAANEKISASEIDRELKLLRFQFRDQNTWTAALRSNSLSESQLRGLVADDLRARRWILRRLASQLEVTAEECRQSYEKHPETYAQPVRFRVSHLFLAAPAETLPEIVDAKKQAIEALSKRIKEGENFAELVASTSEDEATKVRGGDLGFFSAYRMPPDFLAAAVKIPLDKIGQPIRTALGFHIVQATDRRPAGQMTFDEARDEVAGVLADGQRRVALERLDVDLGARVRAVRSFSDGRMTK